jgi:predicted dehydrogenase
MGNRHTMLLGFIPNAEVVLFVDPNPAAIDGIRARHRLPDVPGVASLDDPAVRERADAVIIAVHHDLHPQMAIAAADAGKHIYIEKPLALITEACREIEAAVQRNHVQLIVGFQARHAPLVQTAHQAIPRPKIIVGEVIDSRWADTGWAQDPLTGGGNVLSQGVHGLDLVCYLAGGEPVSVHAVGGTVTHDPATTSVIDSVLATIQFDNGAFASVTIGDFGPDAYVGKHFYQLFDGHGRSATIYGRYSGVRLYEGGAWIDYTATEVKRGRLVGIGRIPETESADVSSAHLTDLDKADPVGPSGYTGNLAEFVECALHNRPPAIAAGVQDGIRATRLALACFESIRTRRVVEL